MTLLSILGVDTEGSPLKKKVRWMCSHHTVFLTLIIITPWSQSASEIFWLSNRCLSAKLVPNFADRGCCVISMMDPYGRILRFLDWSRYYLFQVAPELYSWGWVNPVPDSLLLRKSGSARNRPRNLWICSQDLWPLNHRGGCSFPYIGHI
jgi:hypothetical protein